MGSWRDVAAAVAQRQQQPAPSAPAIERFGLPDNLTASLRALEYMPAHSGLQTPEHWRSIVRDALAIAREGWATKALALGWSAEDLFGIGPRDDWDFAGLAVWLRGRAIALLDEDRAVVSVGNQRSTFIRGGMGHGTHPTVTPVMLWEFGR